jgi:hypothetical protein
MEPKTPKSEPVYPVPMDDTGNKPADRQDPNNIPRPEEDNPPKYSQP